MWSPSRAVCAAAIALLPLFAGCGVGPHGDEGVERDELGAAATVSAKTEGITLWLSTTARPTERFGQPAWVLEGKTSKNLSSVFSFSSDDELGEAVQTSARKFEVYVDGPQLDHLLAGYRLLLEMKAATGSVPTYFASIRLSPELGHFSGSSKIFVHESLAPIVVGADVRYRNQVDLAKGYGSLAAVADSGAVPLEIAGSGTHHRVDWTGPALLSVGDGQIHLSANASKKVTKNAGVDIAVSSLELTTAMPLETWPDPVCDDPVLACLEALPPAELDRSSCGAAIDVLPCLWALAPKVDATMFAVNLAAHLVDWYASHGADVAASGGNTLQQAQALVGAGKVTLLTDPEADPDAHDLSKFIVFSHPDIVWPGSDIVWFGAYDKETGALQSIYDFN